MKPDEVIEVLIPTSPIPSHPSVEIIEETILSIRHWLPEAKIWLMCDGVRPEQEEEYGQKYACYLAIISSKMYCGEWGNVAALSFKKHTHQVGMTRHTLHNVKAPLVLFMEHDCPLVTDRAIDWKGIIFTLCGGEVNCVRFLNESRVAPHHLYLFEEQFESTLGVPLWKTRQWSQRPHVATVQMYKQAMNVFSTEANTMIEDRLMTFVEHSPWEAWKASVYIPGDNFMRSRHLDGRGSDSKFESEMRF
jgi:hypothetical protein